MSSFLLGFMRKGLRSEVAYGALLVYSPRGLSEASKRARDVCYKIKGGDTWRGGLVRRKFALRAVTIMMPFAFAVLGGTGHRPIGIQVPSIRELGRVQLGIYRRLCVSENLASGKAVYLASEEQRGLAAANAWLRVSARFPAACDRR